jgi:TorA maturation chaperone TorD
MPVDTDSHEAAVTLAQFRQAAAEDLRLLARLHDQEPERATLEALRKSPVQDQLGVILQSEMGREATDLMDQALRDLPEQIDQATLDDLAAEYANIYLTYVYRASPTESVWFDDGGLERQEPMFQIRRWYQERRLAPSDTLKRPDDHLVFQLQFIACLLERVDNEQALRDAAQFMDEHLLRWIGEFARRVAARCGAGYFVGAALLTIAHLEELRDLLAACLGEERPSKEEIDARMAPQHTADRAPQCGLAAAKPSF